METPKGTKIKKCKHGHGLFATKNFKNGQKIGLITNGAIRTCENASSVALRIPGKKLYWDETDPSKPKWDSFLDHEEKCNAQIIFKNFNLKKPKAKLVAIKEIKSGDEITINYHYYGDKLYKAKRYRYNKNLSDL